MDIVVMRLADGRRHQILAIVDTASGMSPAIAVDYSLTAEGVIAVLDRLAADRALPAMISVDSGRVFVGQALAAWANRHAVTLEYPRAALVSFNAHLRAACFAEQRFADLTEARPAIEAWRLAYNAGGTPDGAGSPSPEGCAHTEGAADDRQAR